ncbi:hypothetical protein [Umezawaea beigongshangensis]|nr:hypothetical protein [Umezawaea beigongshangensis]
MLGIEPSTIHRAIRLGTLRLERRRGRLVIPVSLLVRLLGDPSGEMP